MFGGVQSRDGRKNVTAAFPALTKMAARLGVSSHALILAYFHQKYPNSVLIPGARTIGHVRDSQKARSLVLSASDMSFLDGL